MANQDIKDAQGYDPKPGSRTCGKCAHFTSNVRREPSRVYDGYYTIETNQRCGIGGFAVKKLATCNKFEPKHTK